MANLGRLMCLRWTVSRPAFGRRRDLVRSWGGPNLTKRWTARFEALGWVRQRRESRLAWTGVVLFRKLGRLAAARAEIRNSRGKDIPNLRHNLEVYMHVRFWALAFRVSTPRETVTVRTVPAPCASALQLGTASYKFDYPSACQSLNVSRYPRNIDRCKV